MKLEELTPGARMTGITGEVLVTVVANAWIGGNALRLTYRTGGESTPVHSDDDGVQIPLGPFIAIGTPTTGATSWAVSEPTPFPCHSVLAWKPSHGRVNACSSR